MRIWTLAVSILAHSAVLAVLVVVPLFATGALPVPQHVTEIIALLGDVPPLPPPVQVRRRPPVRPSSSQAAPITVPDDVMPETPVEPTDDRPADASASNASGQVDTGDIVGRRETPSIAPPEPPKVRVSSLIAAPRKIHDVPPTYPPIARAAHKEGVVILEAVIAVDGTVQDVRVLRSVPLLDGAAVEAVRQWRFTPTLLNGQPVPVVMTVTVAFSLR